jgi:hypothetical protein
MACAHDGVMGHIRLLATPEPRRVRFLSRCARICYGCLGEGPSMPPLSNTGTDHPTRELGPADAGKPELARP